MEEEKLLAAVSSHSCSMLGLSQNSREQAQREGWLLAFIPADASLLSVVGFFCIYLFFTVIKNCLDTMNGVLFLV